MLTPGRQPMTDQKRASTPVEHRLAQSHPVTGGKLLYISGSVQSIAGLSSSASRISTRPESIYTHDWQPSDIVMWDNRATLHRAGTFDDQSTTPRCLLHRVVAGDPAAYSVQN